jgi:hypothetical protein
MKNLISRFFTKKRIIIASLILVLAIVAIVFGETRVVQVKEETTQGERVTYEFVDPATPFLPDNEFELVTESEVLQLLLHRQTGHFHVIDKRNGQLFRSYPNPEHWDGSESQAWNNHARSPVMMQIVRFQSRRDQAPITSLLHDQGRIDQLSMIENGFKVVFHLPRRGMYIPVEVTLENDFIQTRVIDDEIVETATDSLVSLRVYPFFGADHSVGQDGYLMIPDGPGAVVNFNPDRVGNFTEYEEWVYGHDWAYRVRSFSNRQPIRFPVFGYKSESRAFIGVLHSGEEYARITGAPSGTLTNYNWTTAQWIYRRQFFQRTNTDGTRGFWRFEQERHGYDRVMRYYILDTDKASYVGMAERYRHYLMDEMGMNRRIVENDTIPLHVSLIGGDVEEGFFFDSYMPITTTEQAEKIVNALIQLDIQNMTVAYHAWNRGGNSKFGGNLPVDRRLGGTRGMAEFVQFANSKGIPVYLDVGRVHSRNNTGKDGFRSRRDGVRDLSATISQYTSYIDNSRVTWVSPRFMQQSLYNDIDYYNNLGVDGLFFDYLLGWYVSTDYNDRHLATRHEVRNLIEETAQHVRDNVGNLVGFNLLSFMYPYLDHIYNIYDDYSYDAFLDEPVPFLQIALHGLVSYSTSPINNRDDYTKSFLRAIEYGAHPSVEFTYLTADELLRTKSTRGFNPYFGDWLDEVQMQYQLFNKALAGVQDQFIVGHRSLRDGVRETIYENGTRIIVNYNVVPYRMGDIVVEAESFVLIEGGN